MIGAIILAAGQSRRMGRNKLLLPYGASTVIETIVTEITACDGVRDVVVVTGHEHEQVAALLANSPVRCVFNPTYLQADMLVSIQVGLRALSDETTAALIALGDQPRIRRDIAARVMAAHSAAALVIPSFRMRRGHPILVDRSLWPEILSLPQAAILRDFVRAHETEICHVEVETDSVLRDIDTPDDYGEIVSR